MRRRAALAVAVGAALALPLHAQAAEGSSLRGLRAPAPVDFAPLDAQWPGMAQWPSGPDTQSQAAPQPSALYGLRDRLPKGNTPETARLSYRYSNALTGIFQAGPALQDPYTAGYAVSGQVVRSFGSGLGVGLGLRQRQAGSNVLALGVQQGWGPFSGGYTLYSGRSDTAPSPLHRFALNFGYGNRSSIGLSYTTGQSLHAGLLPYSPGVDSRDWKLSGHHWLAPQWAVTYDVVNSDQAAYRRQGLRFGIRHTF